MTPDFDLDAQNDYNEENTEDTGIEEKSTFPSATPPTQKDADDEKPVKSKVPETKPKEEKKGSIRIEIDSVEKMMSEIAYSTEAFNSAIDRIASNKDLSHILEILSQIKTNQFENFQNIEKNINLDKVEKIIEKKIEASVLKIDKAVNSNIKIIESKTKRTTDRYQKYAEAFEDPDVLDQFSNIEKIEQHMKKFKFKSIIFASITTAIITAAVTGVAAANGLEYYYKNKADSAVKRDMNETQKIAYMLAKKHIQIYDGKKSAQFIFSKKDNVNYFEVKDGRKVLEFAK